MHGRFQPSAATSNKGSARRVPVDDYFFLFLKVGPLVINLAYNSCKFTGIGARLKDNQHLVIINA